MIYSTLMHISLVNINKLVAKTVYLSYCRESPSLFYKALSYCRESPSLFYKAWVFKEKSFYFTVVD